MRKRKNYDVIDLDVNPRSIRRRPTQKSQLDSQMVDKDYVSFLQMLQNRDDYEDFYLDHDNADCYYDEDDDDDDIVDPEYKIFLDNVREDGYSFFLQIQEDDGTKLFLKYEDEDEDNLYDDTTEEEKEKENHSVLELKDEPIDNDSGKEHARLVKGSEIITSRKFLSDCKPGTFSFADENYLMFLDHVWVQGDYLVYRNGDVIVRYGDESNDATDVEKFGENVNEDEDDSVQILGEESVKVHNEKKLEMKLKETLSKPYDKKEHKEKWEAAKDRKPLERLKVMRGCDKWYPTGKKGKSYLDRHRDLDKLLQSAKSDPQRALSLLRCLFFYYENMPHQGSFIPWKNPPTWLHDIICTCQLEDEKCPMKYRGYHEEKRRL